MGISATSRWAQVAWTPRSDAYEAVFFAPMIPWFVCRDDEGRWCVQRHGAWSCVVVLSPAPFTAGLTLEEHARAVADALNRVYAR